MGEVEFGFEVELNCNSLDAILGLPPMMFPVTAESRDDVLNTVTNPI